MSRPKGTKTKYKGYLGVLVREVSRLEKSKASYNRKLIAINKEITRIKIFLSKQGVNLH